MQLAIPIKLPFWQDPQSSLAFAAAAGRAACEVFCALQDETGEELVGQLGKLTFTGCWALNSLHTEYPPYTATSATPRAYLLEVPDSAWLAAATSQRLRTYPNWRRTERPYHHYVVTGAESYLEVLAASYAAGLATPEECRRYAFLWE